MARLPTLDLFAGAGGLSLGFAAAGFEVLAAVERDADAAATFRLGHPGAKLHECDVATLDIAAYRHRVVVVIGGPPCQPWSLGGLRRGHADDRDGIPAFLDAVRLVEPDAFVMENVAGLTRGTARPALERILAACRGEAELPGQRGVLAGYSVHARVLQAADFGVPQKRSRLFVVGVRAGLPFEWPIATHAGAWRPAGAAVGLEPVGESNPSAVRYARSPSIRPDPYHGQLYNGGGRPIDLARPAPTLLATMGGNKTPWVDTLGVVPEYHAHLRAGGAPRTGTVPGARRITIDEAALLQTFPPSMGFSGSRSSQYRQVGNAVPPLLAKAVAGAVAASLAATSAQLA